MGNILTNFNITDKKPVISTSKVWLLVTGVIFILSTITVLILMNFASDTLDMTVYVTIITVTGAIFGSNLCWYSKKAASENHYKLRMAMYNNIVKKRLYFNEEMIKIRQKYGITQEEIEEIENDGDIDECMDEELSSMKEKLNMDRDETETPNELRTFDSI